MSQAYVQEDGISSHTVSLVKTDIGRLERANSNSSSGRNNNSKLEGAKIIYWQTLD
ncbi:hypothetical protein L873DRAFT_1814987, partial [Choiromyces venosus 120613-1]